MLKETYYSVERDLLQCQKRPATVSKETCYSVERDLLQCRKRPTTVSKETCSCCCWDRRRAAGRRASEADAHGLGVEGGHSLRCAPVATRPYMPIHVRIYI